MLWVLCEWDKGNTLWVLSGKMLSHPCSPQASFRGLSNEDLLCTLILVSSQACVGEHCLLPLQGNNLPFVGSLEMWKSSKNMKAS